MEDFFLGIFVAWAVCVSLIVGAGLFAMIRYALTGKYPKYFGEDSYRP